MSRIPDPLRGLLALLLAGGLIWGGLALYNGHQQAIGAERVRAEQQHARDSVALAAATDSLQGTRKALAAASSKLTRTINSYDALRDSIAVNADTPPGQPVTVTAGYVQACDLLRASCAETQAALRADTAAANDLIRRQRTRIATLEADLARERSTATAIKRSFWPTVRGAVVGVAACSLLEKK